MEKWRHGDMEKLRHGDLKRKTKAQAIFLTVFQRAVDTCDFFAEVGNVTLKRNGVTRYRLCHILRAITFSCDNGSHLTER